MVWFKLRCVTGFIVTCRRRRRRRSLPQLDRQAPLVSSRVLHTTPSPRFLKDQEQQPITSFTASGSFPCLLISTNLLLTYNGNPSSSLQSFPVLSQP